MYATLFLLLVPVQSWSAWHSDQQELNKLPDALLQAEVWKLQGENEQLRDVLKVRSQEQAAFDVKYQEEQAVLRAENEQLRAENQALRRQQQATELKQVTSSGQHQSASLGGRRLSGNSCADGYTTADCIGLLSGCCMHWEDEEPV